MELMEGGRWDDREWMERQNGFELLIKEKKNIKKRIKLSIFRDRAKNCDPPLDKGGG